jgi:hypothetical protein
LKGTKMKKLKTTNEPGSEFLPQVTRIKGTKINKLKATHVPGSEFLPPFTVEEATNNLLYGDSVFGDGKMTREEATKFIIQYRNSKEIK